MSFYCVNKCPLCGNSWRGSGPYPNNKNKKERILWLIKECGQHQDKLDEYFSEHGV